MIVAQYEVLGNDAKRNARPARDDRLAACAREAICHGLRVRLSLRDGAIFNAFSHHFVVGYYQMSLRD
jgi:hypothetical protein